MNLLFITIVCWKVFFIEKWYIEGNCNFFPATSARFFPLVCSLRNDYELYFIEKLSRRFLKLSADFQNLFARFIRLSKLIYIDTVRSNEALKLVWLLKSATVQTFLIQSQLFKLLLFIRRKNLENKQKFSTLSRNNNNIFHRLMMAELWFAG